MIHRPGEAVQDHYPEGFAHCYGCGHLNEHGHQIRTFRDGHDTVARFVPQAYHLALPGFVYGGLVASLIDCHGIGTAADAALRAAGREIGDGPTPRYVTAALHVNYLRPTPIGVELELRGHVKHASEQYSFPSCFHALPSMARPQAAHHADSGDGHRTDGSGDAPRTTDGDSPPAAISGYS